MCKKLFFILESVLYVLILISLSVSFFLSFLLAPAKMQFLSTKAVSDKSSFHAFLKCVTVNSLAGFHGCFYFRSEDWSTITISITAGWYADPPLP